MNRLNQKTIGTENFTKLSLVRTSHWIRTRRLNGGTVYRYSAKLRCYTSVESLSGILEAAKKVD